MKYKTVETVPFNTTYYLVDRFRKVKYGPFDSIREAKDYHFMSLWSWYNPFTDVFELTDAEKSHVHNQKMLGREIDHAHLERRYCIATHLSDVVPLDVIFKETGGYHYRNHNWEVRELKWDQTIQRLVKVKGDGKKIKKDWAYTKNGGYGFGRYCEYANRAVGSIRYVRTQAERRASAAHDADYGQGLVRAARRGRHLPHSWDDPRCGMYDLQICWKHSTKRRKQWIPK